MNTTAAPSHQIVVDDCVVDLKNRYVAMALAILFPAAGHYYQGRKNKAYLFAACILGLFVMGMVIGRGRVVYASFSADDFRIQYPAQVLVGLPAAPSLVQAWIGNRDPQRKFLNGFMAPPPIDVNARNNREALSRWHLESSAGFELGTLYTAVAGLLNLLVILDAFAGPIPMPQSNQRHKQPPPT
ncbi:MAG: DUF6677 family protein [Planctomycetota bacterium]|jgi:hypothetical protein